MFNNYSMTQTGIATMVVGTLLVKYGFTEACANEMITNIPLIVGGIVAWIGRWRQGDIKLSGGRIR